MAVTLLKPETRTGADEEAGVVLPIPSSPLPFEPQQATVVSVSKAHVTVQLAEPATTPDN